MKDMINPEMIKKISTPIAPNGNIFSSPNEWFRTTSEAAKNLKSCML
tara:strand:+ start:342 stop:482 length:141 start_codon:yes stop_codon:yes gene_type:complete